MESSVSPCKLVETPSQISQASDIEWGVLVYS
ncbi:hypothetical protein PSYPI_43286, partial [Pseudomonas syringae pv. pisi str. 1704B]